MLGLADRESLDVAGGKLLWVAAGAGATKGPETAGDTWPLTATGMGCGLTVCPVLGKAAKGAVRRFVSGLWPQAVFGLSVEPGRPARHGMPLRESGPSRVPFGAPGSDA